MKHTTMVLILAALFGAGRALEVEDSDAVREMREAREAFFQGPVLDRPPPGPKFVHSKNFIVHFDTIGEHAATRAYAESVSAYAEEVWRLHVDSLGRTPPLDGELGGDERYDIYLWDKGRDIAHAVPDWYVPDTNGPRAYTSFIELATRGAQRELIAYLLRRALDPAALRQSWGQNWGGRVHRKRSWSGAGTMPALRAFRERMALDEAGRPEPGPDFVHSDNFVIHFNPSGEHAASRAYAESVAVYAEEAWRVQVDSLGRTPPRPDRGRGGDDRYDIYLRDMHELTYLGLEQHVPDPGQTDTAHTSYIIVKRDIEFWDILRGAVARRFDRVLDRAALPAPEKPEKQN